MATKRKFDPRAPPDRWLNCPRKSEGFIAGKFIAFKTPLSSDFDVPFENMFTMDMLINAFKNYNAKLGFIIDLTNTTRFYNPDTEVKSRDIKYYKLQCSGHEGAPTLEQTKLFIQICENFISRNPTNIIGVHCTHGFNRTGFLICCYLVEKFDFSVDAAIACFSRERPPGIYKQAYINELFKRYGEPTDNIPQINVYPTWDENTRNSEYGDDDDNGSESAESSANGDENMPLKKRKREFIKANPQFAIKLNDVEACTDLSEITRIQQKVQQLCGWEKAGFPGSQPVSMDILNYQYLRNKSYMVSWKADGTRYLMYIADENHVYMLDRDNSVFRVQNLTFPKREEPYKNLENTLIDGEFVLDVDPSKNDKVPRYLIYDIIQLDTIHVGKSNFRDRLYCINKEIIEPRTIAITDGRIIRNNEPFGVRMKPFYQLIESKKLLSEKFTKNIAHETDGLIFQPVDDPYTCGQCDGILKWKPPSMNSVDFKLNIVNFERAGYLAQDCEIGELYVGNYEQPYGTIKLNKTLRKLNGKIIECKWEDNQWKLMRERTDKSYPNALKTAVSVCESIRNPVTENMLFSLIDEVEKKQKMPPPISNKVIK